MEELKCDICGKTGFKSKAGLAGHNKIAHGADTRKTIPDEIGKRLDKVEKNLAGHVTLTNEIVKILTNWKKNGTEMERGIIRVLGKQQMVNTQAICRLAHTIYTPDSAILVTLRKTAKCEHPDDPDCLKEKDAK